MKRVTILGSAVQIPNESIVTIQLFTRSSGTIHENYGREWWYMKVMFQIGVTPLATPEFLLAKGTDGYGNDGPINNNLFVKLHKYGGIPEEVSTPLTNFLLDEFNKGEVKEEDMMNKMYELFEIRR